MAQTLWHNNDYLSLIYLFLKHGIFEKWKQNEELVVLGVKVVLCLLHQIKITALQNRTRVIGYGSYFDIP